MRGPVAWMTRHGVAANLLMLLCLLGGVLTSFKIKQEVFPEFELDRISISVPYPGAGPEEVEKGIVQSIEEAVRGLDGVKRITASAFEGSGRATLELLDGADPDRVLSDVKTAIDRITSFPEDAEQPVISLLLNRSQVISLVVYGDLPEQTLRAIGEQTRDELLALKSITQVDLTGVRPREIAVEIPQQALRAYNLTLPRVAQMIRQAAVELPAGAVKTPGGEVLLRTDERRELGKEFATLPVVTGPDGVRVSLGQVADITDGFSETDEYARFNGKPAVRIEVFRVGEQTPIEIANAVKGYIADRAQTLPPGVEFAVWNDRSQVYRDRVDLLKRNAVFGLILVFLTLGAFLEIRLAFWVMLGIPISFLGSFLLMPSLDVSFNMLSLFAFIVTLGIVVDDAIVVGENIYEWRQKHPKAPPTEIAIKAAQQVASPVIFAVLTTVVAFSPLLFVPGISGKFFRVIPLIVISVLVLSLVESLFVLPAHLAHLKPQRKSGLLYTITAPQRWTSRGLVRFINGIYVPVAQACVRWRYLTLATGVALLMASVGLIGGGFINFTFLPRVEGDQVTVTARLPFGTPAEQTEKVQARLLQAAQDVVDQIGTDSSEGVYSTVGRGAGGGGPVPRAGSTGSHITAVTLLLVPSNKRDVTSREVTRMWRKAAGDIPGVETLSFKFSTGPGAGAPVSVLLSHPDVEILETAAARLGRTLEDFTGVKDIDPGFSQGKRQLNFKLTPEGEAAGLTQTDLARQLRGSFFGAEALRQQRGRDELRVMVRLPLADRQTEQALESMLLRTPTGEIPLSQAATVDEGRAYTEIRREDARRILNVTADVDRSVANADKVLSSLTTQVMPQLKADFPGLEFEFGGERRERNDSLASLGIGFIFALLCIYGLLAIPFRSYLQPAIVMSVIPFGLVGAVVGHMVLGYDLSIISMFGIVALAGIVVNDSLILVVSINEMRDEGMSPYEAVVAGGARRFRPILLTSLTTFFGLMPMIFEPSVQARFLIPMAISLGFGVLFVTFIVLIIVPAIYCILEDVRGLLGLEDREVMNAPQTITGYGHAAEDA
ncbi:MAG: efflux RND transporter permease subunit [Bradymonadia bacterium]